MVRRCSGLEEELKIDPDNARYVFYAANSRYNAGNYDLALKLYRQRITMADFFEEVDYSRQRVAECLQHLSAPTAEIVGAWLEAYEQNSVSAEALERLAYYYRGKGNFKLAYTFAKLGSEIVFPSHLRLFVNKAVYDYKIWDELAISAYHIGRYQECFDICSKMLTGILPDHYRDRVEANRDFNVVHIKDKFSEYNKDLVSQIKLSNKRSVIVTFTTEKGKFDNFCRAVSSFLACCSDLHLVDKWLCIDDGSSEYDRKLMQALFPFFEFVFNGGDTSYNQITLVTGNFKYWVNLSADWQFFETRKYIGQALMVLENKDNKSEKEKRRRTAKKRKKKTRKRLN